MKNGNFKKIFLTVGGAAAGANVASITVASVATVVSPLVPVIGAIVAGSLSFMAAKSDERDEQASPLRAD